LKSRKKDMTSNVGQKFTPPPFSATATCTVFAEALCDIDLMFMSQRLRKSVLLDGTKQ